MFINIIKSDKNFNINGIIGNIENIFRAFGKTAEITTCVIGTIDGKLDSDYIEKYANKA